MNPECQEIWFVSPQRVIRVDLPRPASVKHISEYIRRMYEDRLPDSGKAPWVNVLHRGKILRFDFYDGMFLLPMKPTEEKEKEL